MRTAACKQHSLNTLSSEDKVSFSKFGLGVARASPFGCIHHAFEFHARARPDLVAVENFDCRITYSELDRQANCLANRLRTLGIAPASRVCVLVERSIFMVVGILAVLKAGAAYVPLDGNVVSINTLDHALCDSGSSLVLVQRKFADRVHNMPSICLEDSICQHTSAAPCLKPSDLSNVNDSAYIIYTSGTTGVPKGVDVTHGNVTNLLCIAPGNLGMGPGLRVSQLMNISFDMAAWEILGSLCNGSTLCLRGKSSGEWRAVMKAVDIVVATPSMLVPHDPRDYPNIKVVAVAGEPCPKALADDWAKYTQFYNCCGPTETTIVNTMHLHSTGLSLRIGRPIPNTDVYVLGREMQPLPIGDTGVMWAGGACVSRGYLNMPDKTGERYRYDPFMDDGSRMFNTGDLGRWCSDGTLEVLGRTDNQVKVKGFRVELDGVASAMETCPGVKVATALLVEGELCGFFAPSTVGAKDVKAAAAKVQPYYAVPTKVLGLDKLPETVNGKTDKRALRELALSLITQASTDSIGSSASIQTCIPSDEPAKLRTSPCHEEKEIVCAIPLPIIAHPLPAYQRDSGATFQPADQSSIHAFSKAKSSFSRSSEDSSRSIEDKALPWTGYEEQHLPEKTQGKFARNLRHQVFSLYRRLFGIVFVANLAVFISVLVRGANAQQLGGIVVANLFCAIMMRQDYVINAFFTVFCAVPSSWPLSIRRICARVYHIGGLHSGCGISGTMWLILFTGEATKEMQQNRKTSIATVAVTYCILLCVIGLVIFAYPAVRTRFHNNFEMTHRFLGWATTAMVWLQTILLTNDYRNPKQPLGNALISSSPFWLVVVMTGSIILPWARLRKVPVRSEVLSSHAIRLHFDYVTPIAGSFTRISDDPLMEWHGFATVPVPGQNGYSLIVSKAGDWTTKQIAQVPTKLWVRGIPTFGVLRIVPLFRRVVFVATGSGIGPCAPCILEQRVPIRLLWTSPNVRQTFGDKLVDAILDASPGAVVYDTRRHGKPDMVKLTYHLVKEFRAEAVCVISNQKLTQKIVYGMTSRGIPAYGAIWDS